MYAVQLWQQSLLMAWQPFCPHPVRICLSKTSQVKSNHLSSSLVWGRLCLKRIKKSKFLANVTSYGLAPISFLCSRFLLNGILLSLIVLQPFRFPSALAQIHIFCIVERSHDVRLEEPLAESAIRRAKYLNVFCGLRWAKRAATLLGWRHGQQQTTITYIATSR